MIYNTFGNTRTKVSKLCSWIPHHGPLQRNLPLTEGTRVLKRAIELGVNFIDTADLYGTHPYIKEVLKDSSRFSNSKQILYAYDSKTAKKL